MFLWSISAFGIVWYGMSMYYFFLISIAIPLAYISGYLGDIDSKENRPKVILSLILFSLLSFYFVDIGLPKDLLVPKNRQKGTYNIGSYKVLQMQLDERTSRLIASEKYILEEEPKNLKQGVVNTLRVNLVS